jgi:phospholipid/cholesterol/gamma-HCH transport system substrate-binding protein
MGDQIKNMLVGLLMIAACAFTISLILFLKPSVGDAKKTYYVRFSNINGIGVGTRVMFAGKPVGEVVAVDEIYDARKQPSDTLGRVYFYQLVLKVDSSVTIYTTDQIAIQTSGLLGEKSIAIIPRTPTKGIVPKPITNQPIYAQSVDPIENAFVELSDLANEMQDTFSYLNTWLEKNGNNIADAIVAFKNTMTEAEKAICDINQSQIVMAAKTAICNFSGAMDRIQNSVKEMQDGQVFANISDMVKELKSASISVNAIAEQIAAGKGTLGRLVEGDDMYLRFTAILGKIDTLMNDVNHYGILFHLNKSWQRQRLQKITLMNSLDSPAAFKDYFEKEVDDVNTAMARLSMLIEKAQQEPEKENILKNKQFTKDFADLLRDVDELADNLRLYNQQLLEAQGAQGNP